jgi:hypothetical protein
MLYAGTDSYGGLHPPPTWQPLMSINFTLALLSSACTHKTTADTTSRAADPDQAAPPL